MTSIPAPGSLYALSASAASSAFDLPIYQNPKRDTPQPGTPYAAVPSRTSNSPDHNAVWARRTLVLSGGTGCNAICGAFGPNATYVLPVSDNGGSSAEIIRVLGGPSIGDIRSRLVRLIPESDHDSPLYRIKNLLAHRIPPELSQEEARNEWREIVEGTSVLWTGIPLDRKETVRGFLVHFENELLKRAGKRFSFRNGSVGNYFLAGAQLFFRSLPSAIFLFSSITTSQANILPVIVTNHTVTIAAHLADKSTLVGQCEISHPMPRLSGPPELALHTEDGTVTEPEPDSLDVLDGLETPDVSAGNTAFSKQGEGGAHEAALTAPISRLFYLNAYGQETQPRPNAAYLRACAESEILVYSCGSLWTSIIPCLALRGVATAIARSSTLRAKVLLLNSKNDRETPGYAALDYINTIVRTLNEADSASIGPRPPSAFVTHMVYLVNGSVPVDTRAIEELGISCIGVRAQSQDKEGVGRFDAGVVFAALQGL